MVVGLMLASCPQAGAQGFGLSVTASAASMQVSNSLTYAINVTNQTFSALADAQVTNQLSPSVQFVSASFSQGSYAISGSNVVFDLGAFPDAGLRN